MSNKKRRLSVPGMIIIAVSFILVVFLLVLLMKYFFLDRNKTIYKDKIDKDPVVNTDKSDKEEETNDYGINLESYTYYVSKDTDFNFLIANIEFNNKSIKYDLEDFVTSEKISLNKVNDYLTKLNSEGIYPSLLNIISEIPEKSGNFTGNFFIPVIDKKAKTLTLSYKEQTFEIELEKNLGDIETLIYKKDSEITDDETFKLKIAGVENLTEINLERNGSPYDLGSQNELFGLICDIECLTKDAFIIESAFFEDSNGYIYNALGSEYKSNDVDNLVGLRVLKASTGAILFELIGGSEEQSTLYYGKLHIKLNNDVNEYIINVSIN